MGEFKVFVLNLSTAVTGKLCSAGSTKINFYSLKSFIYRDFLEVRPRSFIA
jgi:hypothetical protein